MDIIASAKRSIKKIKESFRERPKTEKVNDFWIKRYKHRNHAGLSSKKAMELEIRCLELLSENYICCCGVGDGRHFPEIVDTNRDGKTIVTKDCGETIFDIRKTRKIKQDILPNFGLQVRCIIDNLERNNIKHLDIHRNNLCIKNGVLALIDFDIAVIDDNPESEYLNRRMFMESEMTDSVSVLIKKLIIC